MKVFTAPATCMLPQIVAKQVEGNPLQNRIIFCEDKFTLAIELAVAKHLGGTFCTHVFSFNRFMHKYLPKQEKVLSPEGCSLLVKSVLLQLKKQLICFKNVYDPNLASTVYELIAQLKSAKVTPNDIYTAYQASSGNLKNKLHDIHLIFAQYEQYIASNSLTDGNNRLYALPAFFEADENIKNTDVIVAGFSSLNRTLCEIFKSLYKNAKSLSFVVVAGDNGGVYTNEIYNFVTREFDVESVIKQDCFYEREGLLKGLFNPAVKSADGKYSSKIHLYRAKTAEEEIIHVAQLIKTGVMHGARYNDYSVCAENISGYELLLRRVFGDYQIPLFVDVTKNLGKHPLTRLVLSYLDLVRRNFDSADLLAFVKNPLFEPNKNFSDAFENYFIKFAINRKTVQQPFIYPDENLPIYEDIRKKAVDVCSFMPKNPTFLQAVDAINKMLEAVNAYQNLEQVGQRLYDIGQEELFSLNGQTVEKFSGVLSDAVNLLGEKVLPLSEVKNIIFSGMTACKVSLIPEYSDSVFAGDFRAVKYEGAKNVFAIGLNDGVPACKLDSALLCDRDIAKMEKAAVLVEPKIKEVNRRSRETCCMALASFTDHLYLSYSVKNESGAEATQSEIFDYVTAIFSQNGSKGRVTRIYDRDDYDALSQQVEKSRQNAYAAREYLSSRSAFFAFAGGISNYKEGIKKDFSTPSAYYKAVEGSCDYDVASSILTGANSQIGYYTEGVNYAGGGLSATAIEGYFSCPYKNFLSRGVKLNEREQSSIKANDLGTMVHTVAEAFVKKVDWSASASQAEILAKRIFEEVSALPEYARYKQSEGGRRAFSYIGAECVNFCIYLYDSCKNSCLKPRHLEVSFGMGGYPAISVQTRAGKMSVRGKVDRVDVDNDCMRIIDYKTGSVTTGKDEELFYTGNKLQLYLYAKAFSAKYKPLGLYYFPITADFSTDENPNVMQLKGKTIADVERASLIDNTISAQSVKGTYIDCNLKMGKDGSFTYGQKLLNDQEFEKFMDYAKLIAGEGLSEISEGVIIPSPYDNSCDYCKYMGICGYDGSLDGRTRSFERVDKSAILRALDPMIEQKDVNNEGEDE
ncbi:MAG: PD-(D/E)XK nuclease family protein [Clostridia bacterium]|nr:PD-(D/E)XK nuclease family protein [Clostridia bacterium]